MAACSPRAAAAAAAPAAFLSPTPRPLGSTGSTSTPVFADCPDNDDERERRQRRRSRAVESSLEKLGSPPPRTENWLPPLPRWTNAQMSEHYTTCIRLSAENKITTKNAFELHLIDYMADFLNQDSEHVNFQLAASSLEASAKIYAMRVDSVHADTFRVLDVLGKKPPPARDSDKPEEDSSPVPEAARKAQPKNKQRFKTIEENLSNINVPEGSHRPEVDPMFQRSLATFNECNVAGAFMTGLRALDFRSRLLFPSELVPLPSEESPPLPSTRPVTVPGLKDLLSRCVEKRPICSSLAGFRFTKWDEESHDKSVSELLEKFQKSKHAFDPNLDHDSEEAEGWAPSQPEFLPESPAGDGSQEFQPHGDSLGHSKRSTGATGALPGEGDIRAMSQHVSLNPGEYSYFSPRVLSMWAGPEHWRFQPRQPPPGLEKDSRQKIPKKPFELNFQEKIDFQAYFQETKASTTLAKSTLKSQNGRRTTLPADFNYDPQNLRQLFLKPHVKIDPSSDPVGALDSEDGIEGYDYNNPNDTLNFCPAPPVPDSDDDPDPAELPDQAGLLPLPAHPEAPEPSGISGGNGPECGELELIAEPRKIPKIPIQYARRANRMDMRRLKTTMWELLTEQGEGEEAEPGEEAEEQGAAGGGTELKVAGEKTLSGVFRDLQHRLPPTMAADLSVPLAFLSLLHLANEKNLSLESTEDLSDILVRSED
ncbi:condensin complex subunit 2 isoform X2 [Haemorhous mexicanus]|uniref:condensin complex subunit 2 isoform X2 n=1 Tax=Haemorhous mexicanus TaxID=30427 RepID=UPI0028BEB8DE|nr:condensin complex subunit 2 isoform X2 [Haemorhous mexicanus]